jgi:hypothetical protein
MSNVTFKLFADKMGGRPATGYIGTKGEIFYDQTIGNLRISDGSTAGGKPLAIESLNEVFNNDLIPSADNTYTLGSASFRWKNIYLGPGTLYITDQTLGTQASLGVNNGVLSINNAPQVQLSTLVATTLTGQSTSSDLTIGATGDTGTLFLNRKLKFADNTQQTTAYIPNLIVPRVISGTPTALSIDFSTDSVIHLHTNAATVTATLTNLTAGKQVDVVIFNNIGGTQQYNHGLSTSSNATGGNSFYLCTHPTMWVTYLCVDGTITNTFVKAVV